ATQFVGTPGFAPPEQLALRPCYSSDIYALGMTCLFLLTGRTPIEFVQDSHTGDIRWHHTATVSTHFSNILDKMLCPSPTDRFPSVGALTRELALEPHLDSLAQCLHIRKSEPSGLPRSDALPLDRYLTPTQREAHAIRQWRNKRLNQVS
ncbi:MAG: protein kinase domain-containing protein, partial [Nodosilinea sp.]